MPSILHFTLAVTSRSAFADHVWCSCECTSRDQAFFPG